MADNVSITSGVGTSVAADDVGGVQYQRVKVSIGGDGSADDISGDTTNGIDVDVTRVIPGTSATHLGKAEDAAHSSGDTGVMVLGVRNDSATSFSGTNGDYTPIATTAQGYPIVVGNVANNGADTGNPIKAGGVYNSVAPTLDDADRGDLQLTVNGYLKVSNADLFGGEDLTNNTQGTTPKVVVASTYSPFLYSELTQVTKANIKASEGNVVSIICTNDNASVRYFQLHNKASAPAAGETPIYSFKVPAGTANNPGVLELGTEFFTQAGKYFSTGIGWAISTTYATFTDSATNTEHIAYVHYY